MTRPFTGNGGKSGRPADGVRASERFVTAYSDDWRALAVCAQADPELWHPEKGATARSAREICLSCPVRQECLTFALESVTSYGVYGGLAAGARVPLHKAVFAGADPAAVAAFALRSEETQRWSA